MKDLEVRNIYYGSRSDYVDLFNVIEQICNPSDKPYNNIREKKVLLYLSLNLPKDSSYARNEYTNIICSSLNSLNLIDNTPLSMCQIVGHDYYFHHGEEKKLKCTDSGKKEFKNFIKMLQEGDEEEKEVRKIYFKKMMYIIKKYIRHYSDFNYGKFVNDFLKDYEDKYKEYKMLDMIDILHYLYHEKSSAECFTKENFLNRLNKDLLYQGAIDDNQCEYLLKIIAFVILLRNKIKYEHDDTSVGKIISIVLLCLIINKYKKNNKDLSNTEKGFLSLYNNQLDETLNCLFSGKKFIKDIEF